MEQVEAALAAGDAGFLARWIGEASANRRRLLDTAYGDAGALQRLRVHVPDRPGVIAGIAQALGAERINIADFDLQHLSSERGGTIAILVAGEQEAARAAAILEEQGYGVVVAAVLEEEPSLVGLAARYSTVSRADLAVPAAEADLAVSAHACRVNPQRGVLLGAIAEGDDRAARLRTRRRH